MAKLTLQNESALTTPADRSTWDEAFAKFQKIAAESAALWAEHRKAEEAYAATCPRADRYFDEYGLILSMNRERAAEALRRHLFSEAGLTGLVLYPPDRRKESEEKMDAIGKEAERIADEFIAYRERNEAAREQFRVDEYHDRARDFDKAYFPARDAVMAIPAPDTAALLEKIEIATMSLNDDHAESMLRDARRLLSVQ